MKGERRRCVAGRASSSPTTATTPRGDDLRQLDWNVYARLEKLFVKLFVEEEDVTVHVLVDASASMDFGTPNKLDFARRAAAALAYLGLAHLDRVSVAFLGEGHATHAPPLRGKARVFEVFGFLAAPRSERLTGLAAAARDVCLAAPWTGAARAHQRPHGSGLPRRAPRPRRHTLPALRAPRARAR